MSSCPSGSTYLCGPEPSDLREISWLRQRDIQISGIMSAYEEPISHEFEGKGCSEWFGFSVRITNTSVQSTVFHAKHWYSKVWRRLPYVICRCSVKSARTNPGCSSEKIATSNNDCNLQSKKIHRWYRTLISSPKTTYVKWSLHRSAREGRTELWTLYRNPAGPTKSDKTMTNSAGKSSSQEIPRFTALRAETGSLRTISTHEKKILHLKYISLRTTKTNRNAKRSDYLNSKTSDGRNFSSNRHGYLPIDQRPIIKQN